MAEVFIEIGCEEIPAKMIPHSLAEGRKILDKLLSEIEQRYDFPGFSAHFVQESTLAAMEIYQRIHDPETMETDVGAVAA